VTRLDDDLLHDPRLTLMGLLIEVMAGVDCKTTGQLGQHGVTAAEFGVLLRLARSPQRQLRMTDLTAQTSLTNSGITRVVDRLSQAGLVRREACPSDRRSTYAVITPAGLARLAQALPGHLAEVQRWLLDPLGEGALAEFEAALRAVRDVVRPDATAGIPPAAGSPAYDVPA
jgi:DNA-binding MarR family transcriptional regulator